MTDDKRVEEHRDKLYFAAAKLADYINYHSWLSIVEARYNETMEIHHPSQWLGEIKGTIIDKASDMLEVTTELFGDLRANAINELYYVMKDIAELDSETQMAICGMVIELTMVDRENFGRLIHYWDEPPFDPEEAVTAFLEHIKWMCENVSVKADLL